MVARTTVQLVTVYEKFEISAETSIYGKNNWHLNHEGCKRRFRLKEELFDRVGEIYGMRRKDL